ncbi:MAG: TetR/AcrR family transcriptional regulator [Actinobacteria bacterium]|nr:TetR/AcrR family transcriptional regulator [Actinomycetota bacterium]
MNETTRARLPVDERREQLLRLGVELFSRRPYEDVSIDEIAETAGISRGLLYHYFPGKRDFYVEVVRTAVDELLILIEPDQGAEPDVSQLDRSLRAYLHHVARRRQGYLAVLQGGISGDPEVQRLIDQLRDRVVELILEGLEVDDPSPALRAGLRAWVGYLEGLALARVANGDDVDLDLLVDLARRTLLANLEATAPDRLSRFI